jgi:hypothetical protein
MGLYTTIRIDDKEGQVKCWPELDDRLATVEICDTVPQIDGNSDYYIAMREGGYVTVLDCCVTSWRDNLPAGNVLPVYDKWGGVWTEGNDGLLGEGYRYA